MRYLLVSTLLGSVSYSSVLPSKQSSPHVLHERRELSPGWERTARIDTDAVIPLRLALVQQNLENAYERLMDVSHPSSPTYGKYFSANEVHDLFQPAEETRSAVIDWLANEGVDINKIIHSENKGWLALDLPAHQVERLFQTEYHIYEHQDKGLVSMGCESYSVPHHLAEYIDYIRPGVKMSPPIRRSPLPKRDRSHLRDIGENGSNDRTEFVKRYDEKLPPDLRKCADEVTPTCIKALYNVPQGHLATPGYELGLYEQSSYFESKALNKFFSVYAPWVPKNTFPELNPIDGGRLPPSHCVLKNISHCEEADEDVEIATYLIYPQKVVVYQVDDPYYAKKDFPNFEFNTFLDALDGSYCNYTAYGITGDSPGIDPTYPDPRKGGYKGKLQCGVYKPTKVISISSGEPEQHFPKRYAARQCNEFMKLGLQGHSIFTSSGDSGVGTGRNRPHNTHACLSNATEGLDAEIFSPYYPFDCPYVTTVGGTQIPPGGTVKDSEHVWNSLGGSSGGGFSNYYKMPDYQKAAVEHYFANHDPGYPYYYANFSGTNYGENGGIYARGGRALPDVSANAINQSLVIMNLEVEGGGTSASAPIFASIMNLINEERAQAGKGPVGFVNPVLYQNAWALNDITEGTNPNCGTKGFPAAKGWDPSSGLGTPNYPKLLRLFMSLP